MIDRLAKPLAHEFFHAAKAFGTIDLGNDYSGSGALDELLSTQPAPLQKLAQSVAIRPDAMRTLTDIVRASAKQKLANKRIIIGEAP